MGLKKNNWALSNMKLFGLFFLYLIKLPSRCGDLAEWVRKIKKAKQSKKKRAWPSLGLWEGGVSGAEQKNVLIMGSHRMLARSRVINPVHIFVPSWPRYDGEMH